MSDSRQLTLLWVSMVWLSTPSAIAAAPLAHLVWSRDVKTSGTDFAGAVATDGHGNAYVSGDAFGMLGQTWVGGYDAFVAKFDPSGTPLWIHQFGGPQHESAPGIDATPSGDVVVVGTTEAQLGDHFYGAWDGFVRKYDTFGAVQWTTQLGSASFDTPYNVDVTEMGEVFVAGYIFDLLPNNARGFVTKLSPGGGVLWSRDLFAAGDAYAFGVAADSAGNSFVVGESSSRAPLAGSNESGRAFIAKFDSQGNPLWTRQFGDDVASARDVAIDALGNAFVTGPGGFVRKYDPSGSLMWSRALKPSIAATEISLDGHGLVVVGGVQSNGPFYRIYDADGTFLKTRELGILSAYPAQVSADGNGHVFAFQTVQTSNNFDTMLLKHTIVPEPALLVVATPLGLALACTRRRRC